MLGTLGHRFTDNKECDCEDKCYKCCVTFELNVKFEHDESPDLVQKLVTSKDLKPVATDDGDLMDDVQPVHFSNAKDRENAQDEGILLVKLARGQELHLSAVAILGIGKQHAKWSPVSACSYTNEPIILPNAAALDALSDAQRASIRDACPVQVFGETAKSEAADGTLSVGQNAAGVALPVIWSSAACLTACQPPSLSPSLADRRGASAGGGPPGEVHLLRRVRGALRRHPRGRRPRAALGEARSHHGRTPPRDWTKAEAALCRHTHEPQRTLTRGGGIPAPAFAPLTPRTPHAACVCCRCSATTQSSSSASRRRDHWRRRTWCSRRSTCCARSSRASRRRWLRRWTRISSAAR